MRELTLATGDDAPGIFSLRTSVAEQLTKTFGKGHWSTVGTERGVLHDLKTSRIYVLRDGARIIASCSLATRKPWAINVGYFTPCKQALYLTAMAVHPRSQGAGLGRRCLAGIAGIAREWPAEAIRLDAYDAAAGAGEFYRKCGYRECGRVVYRNTPLVYFELLL